VLTRCQGASVDCADDQKVSCHDIGRLSRMQHESKAYPARKTDFGIHKGPRLVGPVGAQRVSPLFCLSKLVSCMLEVQLKRLGLGGLGSSWH